MRQDLSDYPVLESHVRAHLDTWPDHMPTVISSFGGELIKVICSSCGCSWVPRHMRKVPS